MPRNDPKDLQPPIEYKTRHVARALTQGEIQAAADRSEARAAQMSWTNGLSNRGVKRAGYFDQSQQELTVSKP